MLLGNVSNKPQEKRKEREKLPSRKASICARAGLCLLEISSSSSVFLCYCNFIIFVIPFNSSD